MCMKNLLAITLVSVGVIRGGDVPQVTRLVASNRDKDTRIPVIVPARGQWFQVYDACRLALGLPDNMTVRAGAGNDPETGIPSRVRDPEECYNMSQKDGRYLNVAVFDVKDCLSTHGG